MSSRPQQPKGREDAASALNAAIEVLDLSKDASGIVPAKAVFGSVSVILTMIKVGSFWFLLTDCRLKCTQDTLANRADYVELGLTCADVCTALDRGLNGKRLNDLNNFVCEAINQLTT